MQYKQQGLIHEYLHFLVDNVRLVERVGESHVGYMYRLVENDPRLLTFEQFYHTLYCKQARDSGDADVPEEAEEFSSDEAESSDGSKSDKAGDKSDTTVKVESKPAPKAMGKRKATEWQGAHPGPVQQKRSRGGTVLGTSCTDNLSWITKGMEEGQSRRVW